MLVTDITALIEDSLAVKAFSNWTVRHLLAEMSLWPKNSWNDDGFHCLPKQLKHRVTLSICSLRILASYLTSLSQVPPLNNVYVYIHIYIFICNVYI